MAQRWWFICLQLLHFCYQMAVYVLSEQIHLTSLPKYPTMRALAPKTGTPWTLYSMMSRRFSIGITFTMWTTETICGLPTRSSTQFTTYQRRSIHGMPGLRLRAPRVYLALEMEILKVQLLTAQNHSMSIKSRLYHWWKRKIWSPFG